MWCVLLLGNEYLLQCLECGGQVEAASTLLVQMQVRQARRRRMQQLLERGCVDVGTLGRCRGEQGPRTADNRARHTGARQPPLAVAPCSFSPYIMMSAVRHCRPGFARPMPAGSSQVVMPRLEKGARSSLNVIAPTPMTSLWSPGLFSVPHNGPSLPIADTTTMLLALNSITLSTNGWSRKSGPPIDRLRMSMPE